MKLVSAIIKPFMLDEVRDALLGLGVQGVTVSEVRGFGAQRGRTDVQREEGYAASYLPKLKIDVATSDDAADKVVEAIAKAARTGTIGDGKIFVFSLEQVMRIRTGERGQDAL